MRLCARWLRLALVVAAVLPVSLAAQAPGGSDESPSLYLRPGDVLRLRIWREPDLSGEFPVDEHGVVTLPKLGPLDVGRIAPDSLRARLQHDYAEYLNNPSIEVTVLRRVAVLGAVRQPGLYPVDPTMRISDVLALAGGAAPNGKQNRVELRRDGETVAADLSQASRVADSPIRSGDQLFVPEKGWLSRNPWLFSGMLAALATVSVALLR